MHACYPCLRCWLSGAAPGRGEDAAGTGGGVGVAAGRRPARPSSGSAAAAARAARTAGPSPRPEPAPRPAAPTHGAARRGSRRPATGTGGRSPTQEASAAPRHSFRVPPTGPARSGRLCTARVSTALSGTRWDRTQHPGPRRHERSGYRGPEGRFRLGIPLGLCASVSLPVPGEWGAGLSD